MASFVRQVLSATGTLGEKEDFPGKIMKIQKKLHDLKTSLMVHIDNKYSNFSSNLNDAANVTNQMNELNVEIETLNNNIAIIKLEEAVRETDYVSPICINLRVGSKH